MLSLCCLAVQVLRPALLRLLPHKGLVKMQGVDENGGRGWALMVQIRSWEESGSGGGSPVSRFSYFLYFGVLA